MFVDVVPNRNSPAAVLLRQSYRQNREIRKRTLANLSHWPPNRVEALRRALRGEFDHLGKSAAVCGPVFGLLQALKTLAHDGGLTQALGHGRGGKLALLLVLARVADQGSRLSAVRWARNHAVEEVLGLKHFEEDDLYEALDQVAARQQNIQRSLYRRYRKQHETPPTLFLYDVTSSYFEGQDNEWAAYGYNRDGKRGKKQIVLGLLSDPQGEPLAVEVFAGNTGDPQTVAAQIETLKEDFQAAEVVLVGDRGMINSKQKQALTAAGLRYITALNDPEIRTLLGEGTIQMGLFEEQLCEVEQEGVRYILRQNEAEARRQRQRLQDKLERLAERVKARNEKIAASPRYDAAAGRRQLAVWVLAHKLRRIVGLRLQERRVVIATDEAAREQALALAGCYVVTTNVAAEKLDSDAVQQRYKDLARVERDFRTMKTGLLEVRPIFVRKAERTRGHALVAMLALKLVRLLEQRLRATFGTTDTDPEAVTVPDALAALSRLCFQIHEMDGDQKLLQLPRADAYQSRILEALQVPLPRPPADVSRRRARLKKG